MYNYVREDRQRPASRQHHPLPIARARRVLLDQDAGDDRDLGGGPRGRRQPCVVREDGSVIPGLYAAGELLGAGALQGKAYSGGMMVTPSLTFGRPLGSRILPV